MGKDTFLKLLVAQLKYQNPLEPTDSAAFMAQTAQFTVVEKLDALTKNNAELLSTNRALERQLPDRPVRRLPRPRRRGRRRHRSPACASTRPVPSCSPETRRSPSQG